MTDEQCRQICRALGAIKYQLASIWFILFLIMIVIALK